MEYVKNKKIDFEFFTQNAFCRNTEFPECCIHDDALKKFVYFSKIEIEKDKFFMVKREFNYCPFCGENYGMD